METELRQDWITSPLVPKPVQCWKYRALDTNGLRLTDSFLSFVCVLQEKNTTLPLGNTTENCREL